MRESNAIFTISAFVAWVLMVHSAIAFDCPLLRDRSASNWAKFFSQKSPIIFKGKIVSLRFSGMLDDDETGFPVYSVTYQVQENIKGAAPPVFTSFWMAWCEACTSETAKQANQEMVGKDFLVQGNLLLDGISWSFQPDGCWGFVNLPFTFAKGDLLDALKLIVRDTRAPR